MEKEYLTFTEAAEFAKVDRKTIWSWVNIKKHLKTHLVAGRPKIKRAELEAFMAPKAEA